MPFSFKKFLVDDSECGMKVSTDSVVLGAWAPIMGAKQILDIGTGSGLLALMSAQRSQARIVGVELDLDAYNTAIINVANSPWLDRISILQGDIVDFANRNPASFDHIICNPPYFLTGPQAELKARANARHTNTLNFEQLIISIGLLLSKHGKASIILPIDVMPSFSALIENSDLSIATKQSIKPTENKLERRVLMTLSKSQQTLINMPALVLRDEHNQYTEEMVELTKDFYLNL